MGQYYKAMVKNEDGYKVFSPLNNNSGLKLMEHSYIGNEFVNGIMEEIENNPSRIAWVGDYANDDTDFTDQYTEQDYENVWVSRSYYGSRFKVTPEPHLDGYIVNLSKAQYIDLERYVKLGMEDGWCVHPLPLLTAIGNGRGGGDYRGYNRSLVGMWATDFIEYTHSKPKRYTEFLPLFDPNA